METRTIPIFPLDLVLFPRQDLPLTVFEPRYKQMVEDCMMGDRLFGVCLAGRDSIGGWRAPVRVGTDDQDDVVPGRGAGWDAAAHRDGGAGAVPHTGLGAALHG